MAIVVLYHPTQEHLAPKMLPLQRAVDHIVLVDNSETSTQWLSESWRQSLTTPDQVSIIAPGKNLGIAAAQNLALASLLLTSNDQDHVIFFDQDSSIPDTLPAQLVQAFERLNQGLPVAAVGPSFIDQQKGFTYPQVAWSKRGIFQRFIPDAQQSEQAVCALISSGMLTSIKRLKEVGVFDAALFIDYVDTDWSLKAQAKGLQLYVIPTVTMQHAIGNKSVRVLGRELSVHTPLRRYYMMRNSLVMLKKSHVSTRLGLSFIYRTLVHHLIIITLETGRLKQAAALLKGLKDGLKH